MKLNEAVRETKKVKDKIPGEAWGIYQRFNDLVEETGELANAIQVKEGWKTKNRAKSELVGSVCDILYSIFLVADNYNIDLENEDPKVLKGLRKRIDEGDFDHID